MRFLRTIAAAAACLLSAAAASAETLYFSAIPDEDATALTARFSRVADYLSGKLGVDVAFVPVKSYPAAVTAFANDQVQLAWFGGLTSVQARLRNPGARSIAQGREDTDFVAYLIANTATGLRPSEDFPMKAKGMSLTFGAKTSTSGRLMPEYHVRKATGGAPEAFFSTVGFSGDHSQTLRLVASGTYQLGFLNYSVYDKAVADKAPEVETAKVIWKTPPFPDYNWVIRGDVDKRFGEGFTQKVQDALVGMTDPDLLASFPREAFIPATNEEYAPIEQTAKELGLLE